MTNPDRAIAKH